ncbi:MAG: aminoacyl-tRNA hydrolase [Desulfobacterales bacterium]|nr:aminoacyl-tRNA hydrolase [Desulfobacterales bacterium]
MIRITPTISIHENELHLDFIRASGPGGQNVNKVSSAVQLRFDVKGSPSLPEDVRRRLIIQNGRKISENGIIIITARSFRTQRKNREDAIERLKTLIQKASIRPRKRVKTNPSRASKTRRLDSKKHRSKTKQMRKSVKRSFD